MEAIIRRLDSGEAGLRETLDLCREGRALVEFCAAELEAVGAGLEELRLDELVARLEAGRRRPEIRSRSDHHGEAEFDGHGATEGDPTISQISMTTISRRSPTFADERSVGAGDTLYGKAASPTS